MNYHHHFECFQGLEGLNGDLPLAHVGQTLTQLQKEMHEFHISMLDIQERVAILEKQAISAKTEKQEKVCVVRYTKARYVFRGPTKIFVPLLIPLISHCQNTSHDLFNSYFKSDGTPQDYRGQDLSVPAEAHGGQDLSGRADIRLRGQQDLELSGRPQQDLDHAAIGEHEMPMTSSEFQGALPHDMRVHSASSSSREDQPQDLHMAGITRSLRSLHRNDEMVFYREQYEFKIFTCRFDD